MIDVRRSGVAMLLAASALWPNAGCTRRAPESGAAPPAFTGLSQGQVARLVGRDMPAQEREAWAGSVLAALEELDLVPTAETVCQALATLEQESGYRANPEVPNLAKIVAKGIGDYGKRLGPFGPPLVKKVLGAKPAGKTLTFEERFARARTERDVDLAFRDLVAYYEEEYPKSTKAADLLSGAMLGRRLSDYNPITTAGSMQVSVRFARERAAARGVRDEAKVRDELYTRDGGVRYGVARLLGYEAGYETPLHRFADYNAGLYASRNAAVQEQLAKLTGISLALDGDLLAYEADGDVSSKDSNTLRAFVAFAKAHAPDLDEGDVRRDLRREKSLDLESTESYKALKASYRALTGRSPAYARVPEVKLVSPKLSKERTTAWFAGSVERRCNECLARARKAAP